LVWRDDHEKTVSVSFGGCCSNGAGHDCQAQQQQETKMPRIGCLVGASFIQVRSETLRQGLRDLGYVEGKSILLVAMCRGKIDRLPELAAELVRHR
jgi:hypothetical protein